MYFIRVKQEVLLNQLKLIATKFEEPSVDFQCRVIIASLMVLRYDVYQETIKSSRKITKGFHALISNGNLGNLSKLILDLRSSW